MNILFTMKIKCVYNDDFQCHKFLKKYLRHFNVASLLPFGFKPLSTNECSPNGLYPMAQKMHAISFARKQKLNLTRLMKRIRNRPYRFEWNKGTFGKRSEDDLQ